MRILVTGSEGEVGKVLLPQLARKHDVVGFDLRPPTGTLPAIQGDLSCPCEIAPHLKGIDAVVHLAALLPKGEEEPSRYVDLNVKATGTLLHAAVHAGVKRFVYCSTVWASGHGDTEPYLPIDEEVPCAPVCMYGQTKLMGEQMTSWYARKHAIETVIIRFCGFEPAKGYTDEGEIRWESANLPALFLRYVGAGFKLMNPVDLGRSFSLAAELPRATGGRYIIGCSTPYTDADAAELRSRPAAVVDRYYPGTARLLEELGIAIPPVTFFFSHEKAREQLGFRSAHDLGDLARIYRLWRNR
jgi:UDP-glucose 4-epimerase